MRCLSVYRAQVRPKRRVSLTLTPISRLMVSVEEWISILQKTDFDDTGTADYSTDETGLV